MHAAKSHTRKVNLSIHFRLFTKALEVFWQKTFSCQHAFILRTFPVQFASVSMTAETACGRQAWNQNLKPMH